MNRIELAIEFILLGVTKAIENYSADNIDLVINEETHMFDIVFHNENNSFPVEASVFNPDYFSQADLYILETELDKLSVGHCW